MNKLLLLAALCASYITQAQYTDCTYECNRRSINGSQNTAYFQNLKMEAYDMRHLKLDITIQPNSRFITGTASYKVITKQLLDTFVIELRNNIYLDSVHVNNVKRVFTRGNDHVYIAFSPAISANTELNLVFFYNGTVSSTAFFSGTSGSTGLTYTASVSESYQAREWFPAKQLLNDKIDSTDIWITTNATNMAGSNGLLQSVIDLPGGLKQFRWKSRYKMNYYLPMVAVANYMEYKNYAKPAAMAPDSILIQHFIVNNSTYFNNQKAQLDKTPPILEKMSELFGLYPFRNEKYGHAQANIGGGMEHQTMSTMQNFGTDLISHELAHQWFGDYVTCATWQDIWINEGFATYGDYLMNEQLTSLYPTGTSAALYMQNIHNNVMSLPGGSVYVPASSLYDENRIFSGRLSYDKGAAILHNLRFEMQSDAVFYNTLRTFLNQYKDTFATGDQFKAVAETVSGKNFTEFFNQWYYGEGYPTISVNATKQNDSITLVVSQTTSMPSVTPFFKGLLEIKIASAQGDTTVIVNQQSNNQSFKILYTKTPTAIVVDPNNWVINQNGTVSLNIVTAINPVDPASAGVKIYPKPAKSNIIVELPTTTFQQLQILDVQGRVMHKESIGTGVNKLNVKLNIPAGTYSIYLSGKKKIVVDKIVVQ